MPSFELSPSADDEERTRRREALTESEMEDVHVVRLETAREVLTPKRYEILDYLDRESVESITDLADRLDRNQAQVSRDLHALAELELIFFDPEGRTKIPKLRHETIVIEPLI